MMTSHSCAACSEWTEDGVKLMFQCRTTTLRAAHHTYVGAARSASSTQRTTHRPWSKHHATACSHAKRGYSHMAAMAKACMRVGVRSVRAPSRRKWLNVTQGSGWDLFGDMRECSLPCTHSLLLSVVNDHDVPAYQYHQSLGGYLAGDWPTQ